MKKSTFYGFISIVLVIVLFAAAWGIGWKITGTWDMRAWGKQTEQNKPADEDKDLPADGDKELTSSGFVVTSGAAKGNLKLAAYSMSASETMGEVHAKDGSYKLTATITPADADFPELQWVMVGFEDMSSPWANGKDANDYVTLTPAGDDGMSAVITCQVAFGEPIIIRAQSKKNPEIYAEATCDYVKRVASVTFNNPLFSFPSSPLTYDVQYSDYTIDTNVVVAIGKEMYLTSGFVGALEEKYHETRYAATDGGQCLVFDYSYSEFLNTDYTNKTITVNHSSFAKSNWCRYDEEWGDSDIDEHEAGVNKLFRQTVAEYDGTMATFEVTWTSEYHGTVFSAGTKTVEVRFDYNSMKIELEKVALSADHIIF